MSEAVATGIGRQRLKLPFSVTKAGSRIPVDAWLIAAAAVTLARYAREEPDTDTDQTVCRACPDGSFEEAAVSVRPQDTAQDAVSRAADLLTTAGGTGWCPAKERAAENLRASKELAHQALVPGIHRVVVLVGDAKAATSLVRRQQADFVLRFGARQWQIEAVCNRDAVPQQIVGGFLRHLRDSLQDILSQSDTAVRECGRPRGSELRQILGRSHGPNCDWPKDEGIADLFVAQARKTPTMTALVERGDGLRKTTYRALEGSAGAIAAALLEAGVRKGSHVLIALPRGQSAVASLLAVAALGAVYVPVDPLFPAVYIEQIVSRVAPVAIVTMRTVQPIGEGVATLFVEDVGYAQSLQLEARSQDDKFAIFFTSGSTGRPKGVVHAQFQFLNRVRWMWQAYPFASSEVVCHRSPLTVMPSAWELLGGLLAGRPTAIASQEIGRDPAALAAFLAEARVSRITVLPSLLWRLLEQPQLPDCLRLVTVGGEMMPPDLPARFRDRLPDAMLLEDFGCTETNTIWHEVICASNQKEGEGGRPISNMAAYVLDRWGAPARRGMIGRLAVAGCSLASEYLNDPEMTTARFSEPCGAEPGKRLFQTGDLAVVTEGHALRAVGREDFQLKIRGLSVDPSEIEVAAASAAGIAACAAVSAPAPREGGELVLFVELETGIELDVQVLRDLIAARLPEFMVPTRIILVDSLPRTKSDKIDRRKLSQMAAQRTFAVPNGASLRDMIRHVTSDILGRPIDLREEGFAFARLGVDSVRVVTLAEQLSKVVGYELPATTLFEHPSIDTLARHLQTTPSLPKAAPALCPAGADDVAVIGMAGRFPGAENVAALWRLLAAGQDVTTEVPADRWDAAAIYDPGLSREGTSVSRWGAFLPDVSGFDAAFFQIAPADAALLDPQQRLGLEVAWHAMEDAGYAPEQLEGLTTGTYIGARSAAWDLYLERMGVPQNRSRLLGTDLSMLASRVAARLRLSGPSMTLDTACSSSMSALHLACRSLVGRECDIALTGGVFLALTPDIYVGTSRLGVFSPSGRCRPFDQQADGFVQGEGAVFLVLKRLSDAQCDRDNIHAVIKGSAIDHGGETNGVGAPCLQSQMRSQLAVQMRFGIPPETVGYIEAHGTGTKLGDEIEIEALRRTYASAQNCAVGSVKANIGHLTAAAGIAGVVKAILCLKNRMIPPSPGPLAVNPRLRLEQTPFRLVSKLEDWPSPPSGKRRAAVNSFGFGGTNVHCVLEEAPSRPEGKNDEPQLVLLSAVSPSALRAQIEQLSHWLSSASGPPSLADIAYSLLVGRERQAYCRAFVANDRADLTVKLANALAEAGHSSGTGPASDPAVRARISALYDELEVRPERPIDILSELGSLAEAGAKLDPQRLHRAGSAKRVSLPGTVFEAQSYWPASETTAPPGRFDELTRQTDSLEAGIPTEHDAEEATLSSVPGPVWARTALRQTVLEALAELLAVSSEAMERAVSLADLGYDSVAAVELKSSLERRLRTEVSIEALAAGGLDELVHGLSARLSGADRPAPARFPQTGLQRSYIFGKATTGWTVGAHVYVEFEIAGIDLDRLLGAWRSVVQKHAMLRATIHGDGTQSIAPSTLELLEVDTATGLDAPAFLNRTNAVRDHLIQRVFRIDDWPMYGFAVTTGADDGRSLVQISIDSALLDGASAEIVFSDWEASYRGQELGPEDAAFMDHVIASEAQRDTIKAQTAYWRNKLRDCPDGPELPRPAAMPAFRWQRLTRRLPQSTWMHLKARAAQLSVFPTSVLLATFARAIGVDERMVSFVSTHAHRPKNLPPRTVGPFTTISLATISFGGASFEQDITALNRQLAEDLSHRHICVSRVLAELARERALPRLPVVFTSDLRDRSDVVSSDWLRSARMTVAQTPGVALECRAAIRAGELEISFDIDARAVCARWAGEALDRLCDLLERQERKTCVAEARTHRTPLTELQRGLLAGRVNPAQNDWHEANIYQEFDVRQLDIARFEAACDALFDSEPSLRLPTDPVSRNKGGVRFRPTIDIHDLTLIEPRAQARTLAAIRMRLLAAHPHQATDPAFRIFVTLLQPDLTRVHIATDMTALDGLGVLLLYRRLLNSCDREPGRARTLPSADLSGGPGYRLETIIEAYEAFAESAQRHGIESDAVLLAALTTALNFAGIPVDRVALALPALGRGGVAEPLSGDHTSMANVEADLGTGALVTRARETAARIAVGLQDSAPRRPARIAFTGCLTAPPMSWPSGARWGDGLTLTPGTDFDCYAQNTGGRLTIHWDVRPWFASRTAVETARAYYEALLRRLIWDEAAWSVGAEKHEEVRNSEMTLT